MSKVVWFLDIDGVLNAFPDPPETGELVFTWKRIAGYPIWYSPQVVEFINSAVESGLVEVRWLTTWEHMANDEFAPETGLGGGWPVEENEFKGLANNWHGWWKADRIRQFRNKNPETRFVWTDDDITFFLTGEERSDLVGDNLSICPHTSVGLTVEHLQQIGHFIGRQSVRVDA